MNDFAGALLPPGVTMAKRQAINEAWPLLDLNVRLGRQASVGLRSAKSRKNGVDTHS